MGSNKTQSHPLGQEYKLCTQIDRAQAFELVLHNVFKRVLNFRHHLLEKGELSVNLPIAACA